MSRGPRDNNPIEQWASQIDWKNTNWKGGVGSIMVFGVFLLVIWGVMTSYYTVQPEGQAVVKRFGRVVAVKPPGLHFKLPFGIDQQTFVPTARVLKQEFGFPGRRPALALSPPVVRRAARLIAPTKETIS